MVDAKKLLDVLLAAIKQRVLRAQVGDSRSTAVIVVTASWADALAGWIQQSVSDTSGCGAPPSMRIFGSSSATVRRSSTAWRSAALLLTGSWSKAKRRCAPASGRRSRSSRTGIRAGRCRASRGHPSDALPTGAVVAQLRSRSGPESFRWWIDPPRVDGGHPRLQDAFRLSPKPGDSRIARIRQPLSLRIRCCQRLKRLFQARLTSSNSPMSGPGKPCARAFPRICRVRGPIGNGIVRVVIDVHSHSSASAFDHKVSSTCSCAVRPRSASREFSTGRPARPAFQDRFVDDPGTQRWLEHFPPQLAHARP